MGGKEGGEGRAKGRRKRKGERGRGEKVEEG